MRYPDENTLSITNFASTVAITLASVFFLLRVGFENPILPVISTLGLGLLLLCLPSSIRFILSRRSPDVSEHWLTSFSALMIFSLLAVSLIGLLLWAIPLDLRLIIVAAGGFSYVVVLIRWLAQGKWIGRLLLIGAALVFGVWIGSVIWGSDYHNPLYLENIVYFNPITDTVYNASVSSMIKTHGVPSTGLNGTRYHFYHYGSHWVFAQITRMLRLDSLTFYQLGYPVTFIPFFLSALASAAVDLRKAFRIQADGWLRTAVVFWLVLMGVLVGVTDTYFYFLSESYLMGLSILVLTIALCGQVIGKIQGQPDAVKDRSVQGFVLVGLPVLMGIMGLMKISVMAVFAAVCVYFFVRWKLYRKSIYVAAMGIMLAAAAATYASTVARGVSEVGYTHPLHAISLALANGFKLYVVQLALIWAFIFLRLIHRRVGSLQELWIRLRQNELADVEALLIIAIAGSLPGMVGLTYSVYYFATIPRFVALIFLLARLPEFLEVFERLPEFALRGRFNLKLRNAALVVLSIAMMVGFGTIMWGHMLRLTAQGDEIRARYAGAVRAGAVGQLSSTEQHQVAVLNPRYQLLGILRELGNLPEAEKRRSVLFIPKTNVVYWNIQFMHCFGSAFAAPALSGIAMLDGLPPTSCNPQPQFGFADYHPVQDRLNLSAADQSGLCRAAQSMGFRQVIIVDTDAIGATTVTKVGCTE